MNAIVNFWSPLIVMLSLAAVLSQLTEEQVQRATIVYRKKPRTLNRVNCNTRGDVICTSQRIYCAGLHVVNNHFVTGAHCLVAADGTIHRPYELDILGIGLTDVEFLMHKDFDGFTGSDIAWIKIQKPIGVDYSIYVAEIGPFKCQNFVLDVRDPNAQGLRSAFRWIAGTVEIKTNYMLDSRRPGVATFNFKRMHHNEEVVMFCNTANNPERYELHYLLLGFRNKEMFLTDCHRAKCGIVSAENVKAPPVADIDITTSSPVTSETSPFNERKNESDNFTNSGLKFVNSGSNYVNKDIDYVKSGSNDVKSDKVFDKHSPNFNRSNVGRDFTNSDPSFANTAPAYVIRGPNFVRSGPSFSNSGPNFTNSDSNFILKGSNFANKDLEFVKSDPDFSNSRSNVSNSSLVFGNSGPDFIVPNPNDVNAGLDGVVSSDTDPDDNDPSNDELSGDFTADDLFHDRSVMPLKEAEAGDLVDEANYDDDYDEDKDDGIEDDDDAEDDSLATTVPSITTRRPARINDFSLTTLEPWLHLWKPQMPAYVFKYTPAVEKSTGYKPMEQERIVPLTNQPTVVHTTINQKPLEESYETVALRSKVVEDIYSSEESEDEYNEDEFNEGGYEDEDVNQTVAENLSYFSLVQHTLPSDPPEMAVNQNQTNSIGLVELIKDDDDQGDMQEVDRTFNWPATFSDQDGLEDVDPQVVAVQNRAYFGSDLPCDWTQIDEDSKEEQPSNHTTMSNRRKNTTTGRGLAKGTNSFASAKFSGLLGKLMVAAAILLATF